MHHLAERITLDRDRAAAARLAESGLEHARALIANSPAPPQHVSGDLAEGRYQVAIRVVQAGRIFLVSTGRTFSGRTFTIRAQAREVFVESRDVPIFVGIQPVPRTPINLASAMTFTCGIDRRTGQAAWYVIADKA